MNEMDDLNSSNPGELELTLGVSAWIQNVAKLASFCGMVL